MAIVRIKWAGKEHYDPLRTIGHAKINGPVKQRTAVVEIGTPCEPDARRKKCGTDVVWPVVRIIDPPGIELLTPAYVCRHEIEAGD